jgi:hypothetical protein
VEEMSVRGKQTNSKHREHAYAQCKERVRDMDTRRNISSKNTSVKSQRQLMQGWQLKRMHMQQAKQQQVKADIRLKNTSGKDAMQLQLNTNILGAPWDNSQK